MTNELLKKNAATLKQGTIAAAKESERGIVDIETLQQTNRSLIETLDEVVKIQNEGREKRAAAETVRWPAWCWRLPFWAVLSASAGPS